MSQTIIDGRGNYSGTDYIWGITKDNFGLVVGSITSLPGFLGSVVISGTSVAWTGIGSVRLNPGSIEVYQTTTADMQVRSTEYGASSGLPNFYSNVAGVYEIPTVTIGDPATAVIMSVANSAALITGDELHDIADAGGPVKIGGRAGSVLFTAVSAINDRTDSFFDLNGRQVTRGWFSTTGHLANVNGSYNDTGSTFNSEIISCEPYTKFNLFYKITKANTPTDIKINVQFSPDSGTTWHDYKNWFFGDLRYDDTAIGTGSILRNVVMGDCIAEHMRISTLAAGVSSTNTFVISGMRVTFKN